jgi:hypothetical protein
MACVHDVARLKDMFKKGARIWNVHKVEFFFKYSDDFLIVETNEKKIFLNCYISHCARINRR